MLSNISQHFVYSQIEKGLARWLALDPTVEQKLVALNGQLFLFSCTKPNLRFYIQIDNAKCTLIRDNIDENEEALPVPNATLEGSLSALIKLLRARSPSALGNKDLSLRGDSSTFERFIAIFQSLDIDFEQPLATVAGDIPAHTIGKLVRGLHKTREKIHSSLSAHAEEYIMHEAKLSPHQYELENFSADIYLLKQDTERLAANIRLLENSIDIQH